MPISVVLADDSFLVLQGLRQVLDGADGIEVAAECGSLESVLTAVDRQAPDVVLTDIRMPPAHSDEGVQIATRLRETHPGVGVVVLSQYTDPAYVRALLEGGSEGRAYLLKERVHDRRQIVEAIQAVAEGSSVVDSKVVEVILAARARGERSPLAQLTPRELEVLAAIAEGKSNTAIADSLVLTKRAVEKHINAIFLKLNLSHSIEADQISPRVTAALMFLSETAEPV